MTTEGKLTFCFFCKNIYKKCWQ